MLKSILKSAILMLIGIFQVACTPKKPQKSDNEQLQDQYALDLASISWEDGWPSKVDCDSTLWAGEACMAGVPVKISLAEYLSGQIERRPDKTCYPLESKSSVSRDMIVGYMGCADVAALQRLADYGEANNWAMGEGAIYDIYLTPTETGILARRIAKLGGGSRPYRSIAPTFIPVAADYARHVQSLEILIDDHVTDAELFILRKNAKENPDDALMQALLGRYTGDFDKAIELLLNPSYAPPSYVRGSDEYRKVHRLMAEAIVLGKVRL